MQRSYAMSFEHVPKVVCATLNFTTGGVPCNTTTNSPTNPPFTRSSKRRKGFPSETHVKRGNRVVHGDKELLEKLGRSDPCPCGSGRSFQELLPEVRPISMEASAITFSR